MKEDIYATDFWTPQMIKRYSKCENFLTNNTDKKIKIIVDDYKNICYYSFTVKKDIFSLCYHPTQAKFIDSILCGETKYLKEYSRFYDFGDIAVKKVIPIGISKKKGGNIITIGVQEIYFEGEIEPIIINHFDETFLVEGDNITIFYHEKFFDKTYKKISKFLTRVNHSYDSIYLHEIPSYLQYMRYCNESSEHLFIIITQKEFELEILYKCKVLYYLFLTDCVCDKFFVVSDIKMLIVALLNEIF